MAESSIIQTSFPLGVGSKTLKRIIFEHPHPEQFLRKLPATALYSIVRVDGLESCTDLIGIASRTQIQSLMDFDLWSGDQINEQSLWAWLSLADAENREEGLTLLQKVLASVDLKIIATLIGRYVEAVVQEEATDRPPGPDFYTPDKGHTWIKVETGSEEHNFFLNRALALMFETSAEVFYQVVSASTLNTPSVLEEESYQERGKRLTEAGVPDEEFARDMTDAWSVAEAVSRLKESGRSERKIEGPSAPAPQIKDAGSLPEPLKTFFQTIKNREELETEFSLLLHACSVRFRVDFADREGFALLTEQMLGCINIGLERLSSIDGREYTPQELHSALGLQGLFKTGLAELLDVRKLGVRILSKLGEEASNDQMLYALSMGLFRNFPHTIQCIQPTGEIIVSNKEQLDVSPKAFSAHAEVEGCRTLLKKIEKTHQSSAVVKEK